MKAIVKAARGPGLVVRDVPKPVCGPSDVLIRVHHAGVCGTDLHIADWNPWAEGRVKPPVTLGHEFAGEIVEVGSEVHEDFKRGELVTAEGHIVCGHCLQCRTGNGHVCQRTSIIGVDRNGAFAEYHAMPAGNVMRLDGIPAEIGAIMDPMGNAFHTVLSTDVSGGIVLILGCGPIGCFAVGIAKAAGAAAVIAVDVNEMRLSLARKMGAARALNPKKDDVDAAVRELSKGDGADLVCEMSGAPAALHSGFKLVRPGGRVHLLGIPDGTVPIDFANEIVFKGITIYGVIGRKMYETWHLMQRFLRSGQFDPRPVITHRFPLEKIDEAIAAIRCGDAGKVILDIGK
jgi:threonine 3-dehydrogenase